MSNCKAILTILMVSMSTIVPHSEAASRAFFVFGDSLVDCGNNNYLATTARADSPPYGIDHPSHRPTGRFSNGFNFPDLIGESMHLNPILPYLNPELDGEKLLDGANFASAGIGILNDTGYQFVNILRIFRQFQLFKEYQNRISAMIGANQAHQLVSDAVVIITLGGNDFVNNYFLRPFSLRRQQFSLPDYCHYLVKEYENILMTLYDLGARRVLVTGTGPLGCIPGELAMYNSRNGKCIAEQNQAAEMFNSQLFKMTQDLNSQLEADVFVGVNAFDMNMDLLNNPRKFGFTTTKQACCGQGPYNGIGICNPLSNLCPNRDLYIFWDAYHPTERTLRLLVNQIMEGSIKYMIPMNLSTIMARDSKI